MTRRKFALALIGMAFIASCDRDKTQRALDKQREANERNGIDPGNAGSGGMGQYGAR